METSNNDNVEFGSVEKALGSLQKQSPLFKSYYSNDGFLKFRKTDNLWGGGILFLATFMIPNFFLN